MYSASDDHYFTAMRVRDELITSWNEFLDHLDQQEDPDALKASLEPLYSQVSNGIGHFLEQSGKGWYTVFYPGSIGLQQQLNELRVKIGLDSTTIAPAKYEPSRVKHFKRSRLR